MTISRMVVCGLLLLATLPWLPSDVGAQGATACREAMEKMTNQAETPSNDELARFKAKCGTQEAGSLKNIDFYRNRVKAYREKLAEAVTTVKMSVEALSR